MADLPRDEFGDFFPEVVNAETVQEAMDGVLFCFIDTGPIFMADFSPKPSSAATFA